MRVALLGAGIIGTVIARDLAHWDPPDALVIGDLDAERAESVANEVGAESAWVDVTDEDVLAAFLDGADVVVNAAQYHVNLDVMRGSLEAGAHYLDLGGLFHTTRRQLQLDGEFATAGLTAVLGIGSCPGIANVHAGDLAERLDTVESVIIYNGATVDTSGALRWPYSLRTIFDEMTQQPIVYRDGEFVPVEPLSEAEDFPFKEPIGVASTHLSLHSEVATIPLSLADRGLRRCEFKIRNFGFSDEAMEMLTFLSNLGLTDTRTRTVGDVEGVVPRDLLIDLLHELDPDPPQHEGFKDIATVAEGTRDGTPVRVRLDTVAWPNDVLGVMGGTTTVGAPAAVVARWVASGELDEPGVHPPEAVVPPGRFYDALAARGFTTTVAEERALASPATGTDEPCRTTTTREAS